MYRETWTVLSGRYNIYRESHLDWNLKLRIPELVVVILYPASNGNGGKKKRIYCFFLCKIEIVCQCPICRRVLIRCSSIRFSWGDSFDPSTRISAPVQRVWEDATASLCQQMTPCHRRNNGQQLNWINSTHAGSFIFSFKAMEDQMIPAGETLYKIPLSLSLAVNDHWNPTIS